MSSQNAPTGGDNAIRLKYIVDTSAVAPAAAQATAAVTRGAEQMATSAAAASATVGQAAQNAVDGATKSTGSMREALRGVGPAVSTVSGALVAMGEKATAGVGQITTGLASLLSNGLNPIAIAGAGGAILLTAVLGSDAEYTERMERAKADLEQLREQSAALSREIVAQRGGPSVQIQTAEESVNLARTRVAELTAQAGVLRSRIAESDRAGGRNSAGLLTELQQVLGELGAAKATYAEALEIVRKTQTVESADAARRAVAARGPSALEEAAGLLGSGSITFAEEQRQADRKRREAEAAAALDRLTGNPGAAMQGTFDAQLEEWAKGSAGTALKARQTETLAYEQNLTEAMSKRKDLELQLRSIESGVGEERLRLLDEITEKEKALAALKASGDPLADAEIVARGLELEQLREQLRLQQAIDSATARAPVATKGTEFNRALAAGTRSAVSDGITEALTDPSNYKSALQSFASAMQSSLNRALADALTDALLGKGGSTSSATGLLPSLFTAITGNKGGDGGGGGSGNGPNVQPGGATTPIGVDFKRSTGERPIVVINSFSERDADAMAQKMSASGAQVVVSRANGEGVSRGVVPSRRRG